MCRIQQFYFIDDNIITTQLNLLCRWFSYESQEYPQFWLRHVTCLVQSRVRKIFDGL